MENTSLKIASKKNNMKASKKQTHWSEYLMFSVCASERGTWACCTGKLDALFSCFPFLKFLLLYHCVGDCFPLSVRILFCSPLSLVCLFLSNRNREKGVEGYLSFLSRTAKNRVFQQSWVKFCLKATAEALCRGRALCWVKASVSLLVHENIIRQSLPVGADSYSWALNTLLDHPPAGFFFFFFSEKKCELTAGVDVLCVAAIKQINTVAHAECHYSKKDKKKKNLIFHWNLRKSRLFQVEVPIPRIQQCKMVYLKSLS